MSLFKDSSYMHRRAGASMGLASAASAKTSIELMRGAGGLAGISIRELFNAFNRNAATAYITMGIFVYVFILWSSWNVMFGRGRFSEDHIALQIVMLFFVNAMMSIAGNARALHKADNELTVDYGFAWFGGGLLLIVIWVFIGIHANDHNLNPELILIGGFVLFNLYPKFMYWIVREIKCEELIIKRVEALVNKPLNPKDPVVVREVGKAWRDTKKRIKLKSLWRPSLMNLFTVPFMYFLLTSSRVV